MGDDVMTNEAEIPLLGGFLTEGVVRVADTVRRPAKASSRFVAQLLGLLESRGVTWAPRYLGQDELGREVFTFIAGSVPAKWDPLLDWQLEAAARLLRQFHDATRGSELAGGRTLVCHHDPSPSNTVFDAAQRPIAFIDFDLAAPGEPLEDLGYLAWSWCVSSKPGRPTVAAQAAQVRLVADSYGLAADSRSGLVDAMLERLARNRAFWIEQLALAQTTRSTPEKMRERVLWSEREFAFITANHARFAAALR